MEIEGETLTLSITNILDIEVNEILKGKGKNTIEKQEQNNSEMPFDPVENYFDTTVPEETNKPTLENEIKNSYGGNGQILSYNKENSGAKVFLATDKIYKELKEDNSNTKIEMQDMMRNFMEQMIAQFATLTAILSTSLQAGITENEKKIIALEAKIANKAESVAVQQLANDISNNTIKPTELNDAIEQLQDNIQQVRTTTVKSEHLIPLEQATTSHNEDIRNSQWEINILKI
ncbi:hypothetical protein BCR36DRAFT_373543 [Piromyces finnis]|uniref:Uncharacterized protein n=1 Tax=Piromyces finnis TaxID=1754191 RepID=A0A1Y1V0Z5_9FUNG|nr:hypothetical protein BCR36DRAFT_373543 [Piromyces finnis]|eukprot:ORX44062.1 hypothetical protein BCR36DRAFT_373543 [Piromyces finnis]